MADKECPSCGSLLRWYHDDGTISCYACGTRLRGQTMYRWDKGFIAFMAVFCFSLVAIIGWVACHG